MTPNKSNINHFTCPDIIIIFNTNKTNYKLQIKYLI